MHPLERTLRQSAIFLGVALNSVDISVCCPAGVGVLLHLAFSLGGGNRHNHGRARSIGLSGRIMSLRRSQPWVCLLGAVAGVVGIEVGVVSGVFNLESSGVD